MDMKVAVIFSQNEKGFLNNDVHQELINELSGTIAEKLVIYSDDETLLKKYPGTMNIPILLKNVINNPNEADIKRVLHTFTNKFPEYYDLQVKKY